MFDSKKNKKGSTNKKSSKSPSVNMLSDGARVKGEIHVEDDIRIAGKLEGDLHTKGKAIISASGEIDGNLNGVYADIAGTIDGEIRVSDKVIIRKSAVIQGNVYTKTLQIEEGAQFNGTLRMSEETVDKMLAKDKNKKNDAKNSEQTNAASSDKKKPATDSAS